MIPIVKQQLGRVPYPLPLQGLLSLVLFAALLSALEAAGSALTARFGLLCLFYGAHLAICWVVPVRRLNTWRRLAYLLLQVGSASLANVLLPVPLLGYVYLVIVLQAIYLLRPLWWIAFATCVYVIWSGLLMIASASFLDWLHDHLTLAFPVLCIIVAAALYARQHRHREQVQQLFQQMQQHYDALAVYLREAQQRATLEERHRLAQTIAADIAAALVQTEQSIGSTISQAQTNLARLEASVVHTRATVAGAVERMRAAVASLRRGPRDDQLAPAGLQPVLTLPPDELLPSRLLRVLAWGLPVAFVAVALPQVLIQRPLTPMLAVLFSLCCATLIGGYVLTQRMRAPLLVPVGLASQALAVFGMVLVTHTLPLMLGLLLVIWQVAMRLSFGQILAFLVGVQTVGGLVFVYGLAVPSIDTVQLLIFCVACVAVAGLVGPARRELGRRREVEARVSRLAQLTSALERQSAEVRLLAIGLERTRLAREIHDDLGHRLMVLHVQLQLVEDLIDEDVGAALDQLRSTHEQLRGAWSSLLGAADAALALEGTTLGPAIERLVEHCRTLTPMRIDLRVVGDLSCIAPPAACALYRAAQEGLTNACKYAQAEQAAVLVSCDDAEARVRVRDNGRGASETTGVDGVYDGGGHFGLVGLRERAELLGGCLEAGPHPEGGFVLDMRVPHPPV